MLSEAQTNIPQATKQLYIAISLCIHSTVNSISTVKWTGALCIEKIADILYIINEWRCLKHMMTSIGMGGVKWLPSSRRYLSLGTLSGSCTSSLGVKGQISVPLIPKRGRQQCLINSCNKICFTGLDN